MKRYNSSKNGDSYTNTSPVGSFSSGVSPYGCYDIAGNVMEWCNDWYDGSYYGSSPSSNPTGPSSGVDRVLRGGSWFDDDIYCRSSLRDWGLPGIGLFNRGFRVAQFPSREGAKGLGQGEGARAGSDTPLTPLGRGEFRNEKDGSVLIEIPAGSFTMGSNNSDYYDEKPVHTVSLDKYYIGKYEVTVGQFKKFCNAKGITMPEQPTWNNRDDHPVINVSWNDAKAYCDWAGLRLPTEAEWEKAARGTDGREYPWGSAWDAGKCNSSENGDGYTNTSPVGSFSSGVSPYGAYDMAGNVWEWCNDWYLSDYYGSSPSSHASGGPVGNPTGPLSGVFRVLRGGSWSLNDNICRSSNRAGGLPGIRINDRGFRVAQ